MKSHASEMTAHTSGPTCPRCRGRDVARSRSRNILDRFGKVLGITPYRCLDCWHRFRRAWA